MFTPQFESFNVFTCAWPATGWFAPHPSPASRTSSSRGDLAVQEHFPVIWKFQQSADSGVSVFGFHSLVSSSSINQQTLFVFRVPASHSSSVTTGSRRGCRFSGALRRFIIRIRWTVTGSSFQLHPKTQFFISDHYLFQFQADRADLVKPAMSSPWEECPFPSHGLEPRHHRCHHHQCWHETCTVLRAQIGQYHRIEFKMFIQLGTNIAS